MINKDLNGWHRINNLPANKGYYIVLEIPSDFIESFERGDFIPSIDDINGSFFDGKEFMFVGFSGDYYKVHDQVNYWRNLELPAKPSSSSDGPDT